jgi:hypothetical protein
MAALFQYRLSSCVDQLYNCSYVSAGRQQAMRSVQLVATKQKRSWTGLYEAAPLRVNLLLPLFTFCRFVLLMDISAILGLDSSTVSLAQVTPDWD